MQMVRKDGWTVADIDKLRDCAGNGYSIYRTAAALRRTVSGIRAKAAKEGLSLRVEGLFAQGAQADTRWKGAMEFNQIQCWIKVKRAEVSHGRPVSRAELKLV
jgi:hypothetical protein